MCDEALSSLRLPARFLRLSIDVTDVDGDPDLRERYGDRVPVILSADGDVLAEGRISGRAAWSAARRARRG